MPKKQATMPLLEFQEEVTRRFNKRSNHSPFGEVLFLTASDHLEDCPTVWRDLFFCEDVQEAGEMFFEDVTMTETPTENGSVVVIGFEKSR